MRFEDADIEEFVALWKEEFGESIAPAEARLRASEVMELYALLAAMPRERPNHGDPILETP